MITESQNTFLEELINNNDIYSANILLKNIFSKNVSDPLVFNKFFEFCMKISRWNIDLPSRTMFLDQADSALIFFSENTDITRETLEIIQKCQAEITEVKKEISSVHYIQEDKIVDELIEKNKECLLKLTEYKFKLQKCNNQNSFQELLKRIEFTENNIQKDLLEESQQKLYEELTKDYQQIISQKLNEFERLKVKAYNKKAVQDYYYVFQEFKRDEEKHKNNFVELKRLVGRRLFCYDANQLYSETMIYYNNVYSYIFSKLDDEGKYRLTELAIDTEKKSY
ncbi:hypothetical protein [Bacillus sp. V5-8f]|uniref:hypothetical protein n=1 Tax=Bacillus sp. V5-8f TaxID=2053044 RepID=UPI000C779A9F|nr:hypothetical protein [Bacillus sp. V5-8f]PLT33628.1 hypothetical protein CUU64_10885 [Bacillus sp. V5-8f]